MLWLEALGFMALRLPGGDDGSGIDEGSVVIVEKRQREEKKEKSDTEKEEELSEHGESRKILKEYGDILSKICYLVFLFFFILGFVIWIFGIFGDRAGEGSGGNGGGRGGGGRWFAGLQIRGSKFQSLDPNSRELELTNLLGLILGCIEAKFCK